MDVTSTLLGQGPAPVFILHLIEWLPDTARTAALVQGNRELWGWGRDRHMMADVFDAINANTRMTAMSKKPIKAVTWPRPKPPSRSNRGGASSIRARFAQGAVPK